MGAKVERRGINRLADRDVKKFITQARAGTAPTTKLSDGGGIFLTLTPAGTPAWRFRYRFAGREQLASLGVYPGVDREAARAARDTMKAQLKAGRDPVVERRLERSRQETASGTTFADVAAQWFAKQEGDWCDDHAKRSRAYFEANVLPVIGRLPIADIDVAMVEKIIRSVERRGKRVAARKILRHVTGVFRFAQAKKLCTDNPAALVPELLSKRRKVTHRPAVLKWDGLGDILRRADAAKLSRSVWLAHRLCAFTAVRIGSVVVAEWSEFHLDADVPKWIIPRDKMKVKDRDFDFTVILSPTIANELRAWREQNGGTGYVFPSPTGSTAYITREALEKAYRKTLKLDGKHSPHSWRSAFSTLARDNDFDREAVELALDHEPRSDVAAAYDRGERLEQRVKLAHWWDTQLSAAQHGGTVLPLRPAGVA